MYKHISINLGGEFCIECINVQQRSRFQLFHGRLAIIPRFNFSCNGRITSIKAGLNKNTSLTNFPSFQVWRPSSPGSRIYSKIGEVQLQSDNQVTNGYYNFEATITLIGEHRTEFQSGDVIGYYHPRQSRYQVKDIFNTGYMLYRFDGSLASNSVDLGEANFTYGNRQPLLQFTVGKIIILLNFIVYN